jgi:hypothetical protein
MPASGLVRVASYFKELKMIVVYWKTLDTTITVMTAMERSDPLYNKAFVALMKF